jgi:hypothetical protein
MQCLFGAKSAGIHPMTEKKGHTNTHCLQQVKLKMPLVPAFIDLKQLFISFHILIILLE